MSMDSSANNSNRTPQQCPPRHLERVRASKSQSYTPANDAMVNAVVSWPLICAALSASPSMVASIASTAFCDARASYVGKNNPPPDQKKTKKKRNDESYYFYRLFRRRRRDGSKYKYQETLEVLYLKRCFCLLANHQLIHPLCYLCICIVAQTKVVECNSRRRIFGAVQVCVKLDCL